MDFRALFKTKLSVKTRAYIILGTEGRDTLIFVHKAPRHLMAFIPTVAIEVQHELDECETLCNEIAELLAKEEYQYFTWQEMRVWSCSKTPGRLAEEGLTIDFNQRGV